jgi:preprotein translocase subunit SecG
MYIVLVILIVIVCTLLGLIVLIQNPKGGGLSSNFSSSSQLMGVQKTGDFLEKGTWALAITLMVLALAVNVVSKGGSGAVNTEYKEQVDKSLKSTPTAPAAAPATQPLQIPAKK